MTEFSFPIVSITEGAAHIQIPDMNQYRVPTDAPVFYNFLMEMNRDISILVVKNYQTLHRHPLKILLPLAATGIRGIRLQLELENIQEIFMNDVSPEACRLMEQNLKLNQLSGILKVTNNDAINFLNTHAQRGQRADVVDIDPFGSPTRFIDSTIRALKMKTGMICLTATDMAPLCGVKQDACLRKYGGRSIRTEYCHESAVRLCLNTLVTTAAKYDIGISPLLCYSADHYIRIFALLQAGALKGNASIQELGYIVHCFQCAFRLPAKNLLSISTQCPNCGADLDYAGPLWLGSLNDLKFCKQLIEEANQMPLGTKTRIMKMIQIIINETTGPITYHNIHHICRQQKISSPPFVDLLNYLRDQGFFASRTHFSRVSIRTSASRPQIADAIQALHSDQ